MRILTNAVLLLAITASNAFGPNITSPAKARPKLTQLRASSSAVANLSSLTVPQLKERLKHHGCKVSGRKVELIERLEAAYALDSGNVVAEDSSDMPSIVNGATHVELDASFANDLRRLTMPQLKQLLKAQGCAVSGTKAELVERLAVAVAKHKRRDADVEQTQTPPKKQKNAGLDAEFDSIFEFNESNISSEATLTSETRSGFAEMKIPSPIKRKLNQIGFHQPTPIQQQAIPIALAGTDVCGLAQTGTGKTLAFGIPLVSKLFDGSANDARRNKSDVLRPKSISALVLAPTRELAHQISDELEKLTEGTSVKSYVVYGGVNIATHERKLERGVHILVATPGRLIDLVNRGALTLKETRFLVLDEADQMLDMGFAKDLGRIAQELPVERQTMLFSATMSREMANVANMYLKDPVKVEVAKSGMTADKITQEIHYLAKIDKMGKLTSLMSKHADERTVIFGRTKHGMEKLCQRLNHEGIEAVSIHGNKSQSQRDRAIKAFKAGDVKVLVATDVAARGLDIPQVKHVYNYELPDKAENYIHRIGRSARAGEDGAAISFCSPEEMGDLAAIEGLLGAAIPVASGAPWARQGVRRFRMDAGVQRQRRGQSNNDMRRRYR